MDEGYDYDDSPFHGFLGMKLLTTGGGKATVGIEIRDEFRNIYGMVHGALISAIMDSAGVQSVRSLCPASVSCSTLNLDVTYVKPAYGDHLSARAEALHVGGRTGLASVSIMDGETTVAHARVLVYIHRPRTGKNGAAQ